MHGLKIFIISVFLSSFLLSKVFTFSTARLDRLKREQPETDDDLPYCSDEEEYEDGLFSWSMDEQSMADTTETGKPSTTTASAVQNGQNEETEPKSTPCRPTPDRSGDSNDSEPPTPTPEVKKGGESISLGDQNEVNDPQLGPEVPSAIPKDQNEENEPKTSIEAPLAIPNDQNEETKPESTPSRPTPDRSGDSNDSKLPTTTPEVKKGGEPTNLKHQSEKNEPKPSIEAPSAIPNDHNEETKPESTPRRPTPDRSGDSNDSEPPTTTPEVKKGGEPINLKDQREGNEPKPSTTAPSAIQKESEQGQLPNENKDTPASIHPTSSNNQEMQTTMSSKTNSEDFNKKTTETSQKPDQNVTTKKPRRRRPCRPRNYSFPPATKKNQRNISPANCRYGSVKK